MSDQREPLISQHPDDQGSSTCSPPPYSAAPVGSSPYKSGAVGKGYGSLRENASDTTAIISTLSFEDETVRRAFVRKVFSIVTLQLVFTFSVVCVFTFSSVVKNAVQNNLWAYLCSYLVFAVVIMIFIPCVYICESFGRRHPWNLLGLFIITLSLSYMVGTIASFHNTTAVVITMGVTLVISVAIIIFSAQTRFDFTIYSGVLLILAVDVVMFVFFCTFYSSHMASITYGCLGALVYSLFLMIDCQLMVGMMSDRVNPEEYVLAALMIYLDIMVIFLYLLGMSNSNAS